MRFFKFISYVLLGSALFLGYSCTPDDEPSNIIDGSSSENIISIPPEDPHAKDEYYVRYSGGASTTMHKSVVVDCYYTDADGTSGKFHGKGFNTTIGPVKYGFTASLAVTGGYWQTAKIEISKNNGPFTQKAYSTSGRTTYTIDF